jgi:hypothetical protein
MDIKYAPQNFIERVSKCDHLTNNETEYLKKLLLKFEPLFFDTLDKWNIDPIDSG